MEMIIGIILSIVTFYILGLSAQIFLFRPKRLSVTDFDEFFGLGFAFAAILLILTSLLSIKFSWVLFLSLSVAIFSVIFLCYRPVVLTPKKKKLNLLNYFFIFLVLIFLTDVFLKTFSEPIWGCDAYTLWLGRARAFFIDKNINAENLKRFWPTEHPPLWSFTIAWAYVFLNQSNELVMRFLPFLFYILIIFSFLKHLKANLFLKFVFIFFLMTLPQLVTNVIDFSLAGNADLFLSFYFLLGVMAIYEKRFEQAGLFFALGSWVKSDGTPAVLTFILLIMIFNFKNKLRPMITALLPTIMLFGSKHLLNISSRYFTQLYSRPYLEYIWYDLMAFREELRKISNWHVGWWLFFFVFIVNLKKILKEKQVLFAYLMVILQILSYAFIFLITPENQAGHIASAIYRLLLHVAPAASFLTFIQIAQVL